MALSIPGASVFKKRKPVTLQSEQKAVAEPMALQPQQAKKPKAPPSAPRETVPTPSPAMQLPNQQPSSPVANAPVTVSAPEQTGPAMTTFSNGPAPAPPMPTLPDAGKQPALPTTQERGPPASVTPPMQMPEKTSPYASTLDKNSNGIPDAFERTSDKPPPAPPAPPAPSEPPPPPEPTSNDQFDENVRKLLDQIVSGKGMNVDTSQEEALIKELMQDRLGQQLVNQRASMGRAGFGASGALAAMEGDIQRQAGQQATQETLGLRRQAEQEAIDNAMRAVGVDISQRQEGRQSEFDQQFLDALNSALGQESGQQSNPNEPAGTYEEATKRQEGAKRVASLESAVSEYVKNGSDWKSLPVRDPPKSGNYTTYDGGVDRNGEPTAAGPIYFDLDSGELFRKK